MQKYTPKVAETIREMQRTGLRIRRKMELTGLTRTTATASAFAYLGHREMTERTYSMVMATKGDLIDLVPGTGGLGTGEYELTERGKTIVLDRTGQEQPGGWVEPPRKPTPWPGNKIYLYPGLNVYVYHEEESDNKGWYDNIGMGNPEPCLQVPGFQPYAYLEGGKERLVETLAQHLKKQQADPQNAKYTFLSYPQAVNHFKWETHAGLPILMSREWEGFIEFSSEDGNFYGFVKSRHGFHGFEPHSPHVEEVIEELCISLATGSFDSSLFDYDECDRTIGNRTLGRARALQNKEIKSGRKIWYFKVGVLINPREDAERVYRVISATGDAELRLRELVDKP